MTKDVFCFCCYFLCNYIVFPRRAYHRAKDDSVSWSTEQWIWCTEHIHTGDCWTGFEQADGELVYCHLYLVPACLAIFLSVTIYSIHTSLSPTDLRFCQAIVPPSRPVPSRPVPFRPLLFSFLSFTPSPPPYLFTSPATDVSNPAVYISSLSTLPPA